MKKCDSVQDMCERASRIAENSVMNHRHGAVVIHDGKVVAEGYNHESSGMKHQFSIHAEVDALSKVRKLSKAFLAECEMIVVRIGPQTFKNALKLSMPCTRCKNYIERLGIRKVYYSTNDEFDDVVRGSQMFTTNTEKFFEMRKASSLYTQRRKFQNEIDPTPGTHNTPCGSVGGSSSSSGASSAASSSSDEECLQRSTLNARGRPHSQSLQQRQRRQQRQQQCDM
jgi:deoxycytidylate deaminase